MIAHWIGFSRSKYGNFPITASSTLEPLVHLFPEFFLHPHCPLSLCFNPYSSLAPCIAKSFLGWLLFRIESRVIRALIEHGFNLRPHLSDCHALLYRWESKLLPNVLQLLLH